jgi:hypothetical protein
MSRSYRLPINKYYGSKKDFYWKIVRRAHRQTIQSLNANTHERAVGAYNGPIRPISWFITVQDETFEEPVFKDRRSLVSGYAYLDEKIDYRFHLTLFFDKEWVNRQRRK